jgi:hypothetical protein
MSASYTESLAASALAHSKLDEMRLGLSMAVTKAEAAAAAAAAAEAAIVTAMAEGGDPTEDQFGAVTRTGLVARGTAAAVQTAQARVTAAEAEARTADAALKKARHPAYRAAFEAAGEDFLAHWEACCAARRRWIAVSNSARADGLELDVEGHSARTFKGRTEAISAAAGLRADALMQREGTGPGSIPAAEWSTINRG